MVVVAARLPLGLARRGAPVGEAWDDAALVLPRALAGTRWRDELTDREIIDERGRLRLAGLLDVWPVAVLVSG
jgi:hypothetical protein